MRSARARLAVLDGLIVSAAVIGAGFASGAFVGTVKGYDGWGHLTKVVLVVAKFPAIDWNADWYNGSPFFLGGYPPLFYLAAAALNGLGVGAMSAMNVLMAVSYLAMTVSLFGLVRVATGSRLGGMVAAGLAMATPAFWTPYVQGGLYTRVFGMGFASLAIFLALVYLRRPTWARYVACVAATLGALSSHIVLAALAVSTVALVLMFTPDGEGRIRWPRVALVAPMVLLAAYYYLPLAFSFQSGAQQTASYPALDLAGLALSLVPVLPATALLVLARLRSRSSRAATSDRLMVVLGAVSALMLLYALAPLPRVAGLHSPDMLFFIVWFGAALAGLVLGSIKVPTTAWQRQGSAIAAVAATAILVAMGVPAVASSAVRNPADPQNITAGWHPVDAPDGSFRVASPSDNLSAWFNGVYDVPQTRGYAAIPQMLNPDFLYWLDTTAWSADASDEQRTFLFDWYAVRWIYVPAPYMASTAGVLPRLHARPDLYAPVGPGNGGTTLTFEYLRPSPIAAATNAPIVLFIGDPSDYRLVFRDLSYSGFDSEHAVLVDGGPYVDDLTAQELSRFDEVVIYGGRAHDQARALDLLTRYVTSGGGMVLDKGGLSLPVTATRAVQVSNDWQFRAESSPITDGIDFSAFGPPSYNGGPWTVSTATGLKSWVHPVLWSGSDPVVATGQLGAGRVVWSGLNLPYHVDTFRNAEESRFLTSAIAWASRHGSMPAAVSTAHQADPQLLVVSVPSPARGILFKETYFDRWHAYVNGDAATIYRAGPGFMYVMLPPSTAFPATVTWRYERSLADWSGMVVSGVTLIGLIAWPRWQGTVRRRFGIWWDSRTTRWAEDETS